MPQSDVFNMDVVVEVVRSLQPKSILEVCCGDGMYGMLFRRYLDYWHYKYKPEHWKVRIDALEVFSEYITPIHDYVYNKVVVGDATKVDSDFWSPYDLVHMGDVIEHIEKAEVRKILHDMKEAGVKWIVISTPLDCKLTERNYNGNTRESHVSSWSKMELLTLPDWIMFSYAIREGQITIVLEAK